MKNQRTKQNYKGYEITPVNQDEWSIEIDGFLVADWRLSKLYDIINKDIIRLDNERAKRLSESQTELF